VLDSATDYGAGITDDQPTEAAELARTFAVSQKDVDAVFIPAPFFCMMMHVQQYLHTHGRAHFPR
jgi:hypothetical protein